MKINYAAIIGTGLGLLGGAAVGFYVTRKSDVKTFNEALESREKYFTEKYDKAIAKLHEYEHMLETLEASNTKLLKILNNSNFKANSSSAEEATEEKETEELEYDIDKNKLVGQETTEEEDDYEEEFAANDEWPETAADEEIVHVEWVDNDDDDDDDDDADDDFEPWEGLDNVNVDESDDDYDNISVIFDEDDVAELLDPVNTRNRIKSYGITEDDEKIWRADKEPLHTGFRSQGEYEDYMKNRWFFYDESIPKKELNGVNVRIWTEEMIKKTGYVTREAYEYYTKLNKTYKRIPK